MGVQAPSTAEWRSPEPASCCVPVNQRVAQVVFLLAVLLLTTHCLLPTTCYRCLLPTACYPLPAACYLLPAACCLLPAACV